jgi:chromosome segregation ATPase
MDALKREFLQLLDTDIEFRYAVAGYLGLSEILKRLDSLSEEMVRLRKGQVRLRREQIRLRREQVRLTEEQVKIWGEIQGLKEEQVKIWGEIQGLKEEQVKIWGEIQGLKEEQMKLREDFNKMLAVIERMDTRLNRVERTLEKLTVDVEDEARSILKWRIRNELGVELELTSLALPRMEVNIYGAVGDLCVVGEATVRGGVEIADELLRKIERMRVEHPEMLRRNIIKVIYVCLPLPDLIERGKEEGIWILKATEDFHRPQIKID